MQESLLTGNRSADMIRKTKKINVNRHLAIFILMFYGTGLTTYLYASGRDEKGMLVHNKLERTYHIHFPEGYLKSQKLPLILALHGRGGEGESMILVTRGGFSRPSDRDGFIVVYPDGIDKGWNDGRIDSSTRWRLTGC